MRNVFLSALIMIMGVAAFAQTVADAKTQEGFMRSDGKIYVVMAIVITILTGLIIYLVRLDRKISRLEKGKD